MALTKIKGSKISGLISVVPKYTEDNLELQDISVNEKEQLVLRTGIRFRKRVTSNDIGVEKLFQSAIERLLDKLQWNKDSIDILICVTQTPKTPIPSIACKLHGDMEFSLNTMCYDINSGCSGFVYGLHTVSSLLSSISKSGARAILCCGDVSSSSIDINDKSVQCIFSDAVSAIGIESTDDLENVTGYFNLETAGSGQNAISMPNEEGQKNYMRLNGIDVFNYSVKLVPNNIRNLLTFSDKTMEFPDQFIFHQANKIINDFIIRNLKIDIKKAPTSLYEYGNTAGASIPLTLGNSWNRNLTKSGWILISGFGVGFSVASAIIQFDPIIYDAPFEIDY